MQMSIPDPAVFAFPGFMLFLVVGIIEVVIGVFLLLGLLRGKKGGTLARVLGGIALIGFGIVFINLRSTGQIYLADGSMELRVPFNRDKQVQAEEIVSVIAVNITVDREFYPSRRVSGGELGDIRTGWFKLNNGRKTFLALQGPRALFIETTLGFPLLVGTDEFEAFESAFSDHLMAEVE
jgi:hypothetical protein